MMTAGKGYNLKNLDMTAVENETLKNGVFNGCNLLENITFPMGLQYVPREACRNCSKAENGSCERRSDLYRSPCLW